MKHKSVNMTTAIKATLLFLFSLSIPLHYVNAAGLRATSARATIQEKEDMVNQEHHALQNDQQATSDQETEVLRLTDDDDIEFFKSEIELGYLDRNDFDKAMLASQIADDDGVEMEDDDQYRDRATGGFIHNHTSEVEDL
jgi:TATA-binding protein-associated factor Taf7